MPLTKLNIQPGIFPDDSPLSAENYFVDADKIRFVNGKPETILGHEKASTDTVYGKARGMMTWSDNSRNPYLAIGTHTDLVAMDNDGELYNITPIIERGVLGSNPFTTVNESADVTVADTGHGLIVDQLVRFSGATAVGGITIDGEYHVTEVSSANAYKITHASAASSGATGGGTTVSYEYGLAPGSEFDLGQLGYGSGTYGSGTYGSVVTGYETFARTWTLDKWGQNLLACPRQGQIYEWSPQTSASEAVANGDFATIGTSWTRGTGWSATGSDIKASAASSDLSQSITLNAGAWALLDFDTSIASGSIYAYWGTTTIKAGIGASGRYKKVFYTGNGGSQSLKLTGGGLNGAVDNVSVKQLMSANPIPNQPSKVGSMFVTPERILVAVGSTDSNGNYDPLRVAWTDTGNNQTWAGTTANLAGNFTLSNGTHLIRGISTYGENIILGNDMVYSMRFTSDPSTVFNFDLVGTGCGLIGPNAVCEARGKLYWMSPGGQFYVYGAGGVSPLDNPVKRYVMDNLSWNQGDLIYAWHNSKNNEIWWSYPDSRDGNECSRYVIYNYMDATWSIGTFDRTSWCDAGSYQYPLAVDTSGNIYFQEKDFSADGGPRSFSLTSGWIDIGDGDQHLAINAYYPDAEDLQGGYNIQFTTEIRNAIGTNERVYPKQSLTNATGRVDVRATGQIAKITWSATDSPSFYRMGVPSLELYPTNRRR